MHNNETTLKQKTRFGNGGDWISTIKHVKEMCEIQIAGCDTQEMKKDEDNRIINAGQKNMEKHMQMIVSSYIIVTDIHWNCGLHFYLIICIAYIKLLLKAK